MEKNYATMSTEEKFQMQKLMLHHYTTLGIDEGLNDTDLRDYMEYELELFEGDERYEECALVRDVIKIWDDLNDSQIHK